MGQPSAAHLSTTQWDTQNIGNGERECTRETGDGNKMRDISDAFD